jgi:putative toxin-antitoxin system antitoxin component (TIGR02293 family)
MSGEFATVENLLGVQHRPTDSNLSLAESIERGLPVSAIDHLAELVAPHDSGFRFRLIAKATLERRRRANQPLTVDEGDRLARIAKVYGMAWEVFGDTAKVQDFLHRPHRMLDNKRPVDVALATSPGADAVINVLGRAAYGGGV